VQVSQVCRASKVSLETLDDKASAEALDNADSPEGLETPAILEPLGLRVPRALPDGQDQLELQVCGYMIPLSSSSAFMTT